MTARGMAVTLGVFLLAAAGTARAGDDKAVHRGGGDGGGSHASGAADRHPSGDAHASSGSSFSGGSQSAEAVSRSGAELRHPRPGTGTGGRYYHGRSYYYGSPFYYRPYGYGYYPYDGFYSSLYFGYSPYYYSGFYGYSPYYYGYSRPYGSYGYRTGSMRLLVEPKEARVYVDGYYAGIVDDFDGLFQRLNISPGRHEIMFKLDGFRTYRVRVYVPLDQTLKIHYKMVPGSGSEIDEATVGVPGEDPRYDSRYDDRARYEDRAEDRDRYESRDSDRGHDRAESADMGTLRCDVQPSDASIYIDGDFKGTGRQLRALGLPAGHHRVEIVRPGYRTVEREVEIRAGHTTDLGVELER